MMAFKTNIKVFVAVSALVAVTAVAAAAQDGGGQTPPGQNVPQVTAIEAEARDAASVLETTRTSSDALPVELADGIDERPDFGMNPDLSRRAVGGTTSVYFVPADDHVCAALAMGDGGTVICPRTSELADGLAAPATVTLAGGAIAVYGIVPDGVDSVTIAAGADSTQADVVDNGYLAVVPAGSPLQTASYTGPSGPVEFPIYDPSAPTAEQ